ncbi:hypothetical protein RYX45_22245, partial [Alkalihalophilus pseudofirmus]
YQSVWDTPAKWLGVSMGHLKKGYVADLNFFKADVGTLPMYHAPLHTLLSMSSRHIQHVMCDGKWRLWNQQILDFDEDGFKSEYKKAIKTL